MKEKIILATLKLLENSGVKFTIDDIKSELKISKKTIYKYYAGKDELAEAVFDYALEKAKEALNKICESERGGLDKTINGFLEYLEIFRFQEEKIFNFYSLNSNLLLKIKASADDYYQKVLAIYHNFANNGGVRKIDDDILKIIIEGVFKNIYFLNCRKDMGYKCLKAALEK